MLLYWFSPMLQPLQSLLYQLLYRPIFNLLVFLYNIVPGHDFGVSIILLTVLLKLILYPVTSKTLSAQRQMQRLQPQVAKLQQQYKGQKEQLSRELMALYQREKVNPFSSCLPLLIQLPFLIAVYQVFINGLRSSDSLQALYPFVNNPGQLNAVAFGFLNLAQPNLVLAFLAGAAQFWQAKLAEVRRPAVHGGGAKDEDMAAAMSKQMLYMMPALTVFISASLPAGLSLYWVAITLLTVGQQYLMARPKQPSPIPNIVSSGK